MALPEVASLQRPTNKPVDRTCTNTALLFFSILINLYLSQHYVHNPETPRFQAMIRCYLPINTVRIRFAKYKGAFVCIIFQRMI